jgi:O-Antigen ligase
MAYLFALLYLVCVYLRPAEIITGWEEFPFAGVVAAGAAIAVIGSLVLRPRRFWNLPQDWFVLAFLVAVAASNAAWGWMSGALEGTLAMAPAIVCYFLLRSAIESPAHLRGVTYALVALTLFQAVNGIVQFHTGFGIGGVVPIEVQSLLVNDESDGEVRRIRGTGIFNDPNDLALTLVVAVPFLAGPLFRRITPLQVRTLAAFLLVPIVVALYYTNSRGGMLGLAAALLPYSYRRFGKLAGAIAVVAGLALLVALGPSRMANLDASESSAQGRVQSWAEGLQMFKSHPVFGVGFGRYTDFNRLVAHNSFVHTLGELGFLGTFAFVGMGYWFFQSSRRPQPGGAGGWGEDLWHSGLALAVCAMFLSRQYSVMLFVWLALSAAYVQLMAAPSRLPPPRPAVHLVRIAAITTGGVICMYIAVRLLGIWSA